MYLIGWILPLAAFIFESYPRILNRKFGVDVWTHLLYLKEYHRQKGIPKKIEKGFIISGTYDYPPAFILLLSRFPFRLVEKYEFFFSPFFDAIHINLIYIIVFQMSGNILLALTTQLIYILTPIIILENSSATPRSLGYLLFTSTFMLIFSYTQLLSNWYLVLALLSGSLIFLSHRFTAQGFLFFSIFFSIYEKNILFFTVFLSSFILAIILSKGFYLRVLYGHIGNLIFWYKNVRYRFAHQVKGIIGNQTNKDIIFRLYNLFLKFPPFVLTITNPWTLTIFYMWIRNYPEKLLDQRFLYWVMFSYLLAILTTWIPQLRFLGEGQRYLELSAFPTAYLAASQLFSVYKYPLGKYALVFYLIVGISAFVTIVIIQRKAIINEKMRTLTADLEEMFKFLRYLKVKPRLLCIPHQITTSTIYHTNCPVFVNADYTNISKITEVYPFLKKPVRSVMNRYKLDMLLLNQNYATIADLRIKKYKLIKKAGNYILLKPT